MDRLNMVCLLYLRVMYNLICMFMKLGGFEIVVYYI